MPTSIRHLLLVVTCLCALPLFSLSVSADDDDEEDSWTMSSMNPIGREDIEPRLKPLGFGLMGDKIDTDKGTVVFNVTDVSLPGNSDLEVAIRRTAGSWNYTNRQEHYMADWILEVPSISVLIRTSKNWVNNRCSSGGANNFSGGTSNGVTDIVGQNIYGALLPEEWTDGMKLNIPGQGSKMLLEGNNSSYSSFDESRWASKDFFRMTADHWLVGCGVDAINSSAVVDSDGAGEGFIVTAPNGTKYTMSRLHYFEAADYQRLWNGGWFFTGSLKRHMATMLATKVEDVNGNWVRYAYDDDGRLTKIYSNDDRVININYIPDTHYIQSVEANGRTWNYTYKDFAEKHYQKSDVIVKVLATVTQPDGQAWEYDFGGLTRNIASFVNSRESDQTISVKHPYGTKAEYIVADGHQEEVGASCYFDNGQYSESRCWYKRVKTVLEKKLTGLSIPTSTWTYEVPRSGDSNGITEINPAGHVTKYLYQDFTGANNYVHWNGEECLVGTARKLVKTQKYDQLDGSLLEQTEINYDQSSQFGTLSFSDLDAAPTCEYYKTKTEITRYHDDGDDVFTTEYTYDTDPNSVTYSYGKPLTTTSYSNVSTTPRETVLTYEHNTDKWILGLTKTVTTEGREMATFGYDSYGRISWQTKFGSAPAYFYYHTNVDFPGKLYAFRDANGKTTYANDYYRGMPKVIERPDGSKDEVVIDANGWITAQKDFNGYWTTYKRDDMGRITDMILPAGSSGINWDDTHIGYEFDTANGLVKQTFTHGNREEIVTYDSYLRVIREQLNDLTGYSSTIYTNHTFDEMGREVFKSFPSYNINETDGTVKTYDDLGRLKTVFQNVNPDGITTYNYLAGHKKQVVDGKGNATTYYRTGYAGPDKGKLLRIAQPLGVDTYFFRNIWDQLTQLNQRGTQNGITSNKTQFFLYDSQQRLCQHYTSEGGSSLYQYDATGNMVAYENGTGWAGSCVAPSGIGRVDLELDDLYRVTRTNFADAATPDIVKTYDNNGNVLTVDRDGANWTYIYDELNHITDEQLAIDGRDFDLAYQYNSAEHVVQTTLPTGRTVDYDYDGLGREIEILSRSLFETASATLASDIGYHANNTIQYMLYGNGLRYSQTLTKLLQPRSINVMDGDDYLVDMLISYDNLGNVSSIKDYAGTGQKSMDYDALGRLTKADGPWGVGSYTYDALGNLRQKVLGTRSVNIDYNDYNRATSSDDSVNGYRAMAYDTRGNVTSLGDLDFSYDRADQPVQISGSSNGSYKYDGNLKRVKAVVNGKTIYNVYSKSGKLMYVDKISDAKTTEYIHHNGKTLARITNNEVTYLHRDHLGTPIVGSDASGRVLWREIYTPYGEKYTRDAANDDLGGFTDHIYDSATALTYMQARYQDPVIGRFLSVDPVGFTAKSPMSFNRYAYGNNNPYTYVDPDGEFVTVPLAVFGAAVGAIGGGVAAAINGGDFSDMAIAAGAGALVGGVAGLTAGASVAAGSALSVSGFAASAATGAVAAASGEAIGQVAAKGSVVNPSRVGVAGILGIGGGTSGAIAQVVTGSTRSAMVIGTVVEVTLSPGVANADEPEKGEASDESGKDDDKNEDDKNENEEADSV